MPKRKAIVIGASMGGLTAARALANHYEKVVVMERDVLPVGAEQRRGVPQGRHAHGLLGGGAMMLEKYFPGLAESLVARGALRGDLTDGVLWHNEGGYHRQFESGLQGMAMSRPLLESEVRNRVMSLKNIEFRQQVQVEGLLSEGGRVTGVRVKSASGEEAVEADLVVDASGRGSHGVEWLAEMGYAKPRQEEVKVGIGYTTGMFRRKPSELAGKIGLVLSADTRSPRSAAVLAIEEERWIVTLAGYGGDFAPLDHAGYLAWARELPCREVYDLLAGAEPLSDLIGARFPASRRLRFEELGRFPDGLLIYGDAICSFNPVYGQGMTVAAMEMEALDRCLMGGTAGLARRFFARAAKLIDAPWEIAVGNDLRIPSVEGKRTAKVNFVNWYMGKLHRAAQRDEALVRAFQRVANLLAPPESILAPGVVWRVLRQGMA